ncbi:response regulator transcription factor [Kineosporia sp. NBRC 101731]|uniref:response regulator transcription factor n=1 Tax=Kineosporia sp. NBRC 101731 TaxID=3032199 RepID=UPI0024A4F0A1|nr:response regulator transcription factor [Kineosporia sp. NBRC 101731]GLY27326.1 DNA-binding response regulator [Kineosporia sp. NBRC 101731]
MSETTPIRIALVDDQQLVRAGFRMVIDSQPDLRVVVEAANGEEAVARLAGTEVDVVLMDVRMPKMDGIEATRRIVELPHAPKVVVLTTFDLDEYVMSAIGAGASGFLLKDAPPEEMLGALRTVFAGDAVIGASSTRQLLHHIGPILAQGRSQEILGIAPQPGLPAPPPAVNAHWTPTAPDPRTALLQAPPSGDPEHPLPRVLADLTPREYEVFVLMANGLSNAEIAGYFVVSEATVKTHVGRVLTKTAARDRVQIVVLAYQLGVVRP